MPRKREIKILNITFGQRGVWTRSAVRGVVTRRSLLAPLVPAALYLRQVLLDDVVPHLGSIQLSIKASTDHGHDVIDTSHPVLVSQQIPSRKKDRSPGRWTRGSETTQPQAHGDRRTIPLCERFWRHVSCASSSLPKRNNHISSLWKILRANGENFDVTLSLHLCRSEIATGTLTRVTCRLPPQTLSIAWETKSVIHFLERRNRGWLWVQRFFHCSSKINSETKIGSSIWINQMSCGFLVSCPLLW